MSSPFVTIDSVSGPKFAIPQRYTTNSLKATTRLPINRAMIFLKTLLPVDIKAQLPRAKVLRATDAKSPVVTDAPVIVNPADLYPINPPISSAFNYNERVGAEKAIFKVTGYLVDADDEDGDFLRLTISNGMSGEKPSQQIFTGDDDARVVVRIPRQSTYPVAEQTKAIYGLVGSAYTDAKAIIAGRTSNALASNPPQVTVTGYGFHTVVPRIGLSFGDSSSLDVSRGDLEAAAFELSPAFKIATVV